MKRRYYIWVIVFSFSWILLLTGCQRQNSLKDISDILDIDVSSGHQISHYDTHGGVHGDGTTCTVLTFADRTVRNEIEKNNSWQPLPLSTNLATAVYGTATEERSIGPYISDHQGDPLIPVIQNGYYSFWDRHEESTHHKDDSQFLERASYNITVAIYDVDTDTLYYLELDT